MKNYNSKKIKAIVSACVIALGTLLTGCSDSSSDLPTEKPFAWGSTESEDSTAGESIADESRPADDTVSTTDNSAANESTEQPNTVNSDLGTDGTIMPAANGVYQPAENEHRFMDILNEIQSKQKITVTQRVDSLGKDEITFAYSAEDQMQVTYNVLKLYLDEYHSTCNRITLNELFVPGNDWYWKSYWLDLDSKQWTYHTSYFSEDLDEVGFESIAPKEDEYTWGITFGTRDKYKIRGIPDILSPENWTYKKSSTVTINGKNYYCETYDVKFTYHTEADITYDKTKNSEGSYNYTNYRYIEGSGTPFEYSMNVVFDSNGDMAFLGETYLDTSQAYDGMAENQKTLWNLFYDAFTLYKSGDSMAYDTNNIKYYISTNYDQYARISIKPEFDASLYDLNNYELIKDPYEYYAENITDDKESIAKELGLDFE